MSAPSAAPGAPLPSRASITGRSPLLRRPLVLPSEVAPSRQDAAAPPSQVSEAWIDQAASAAAELPAPARSTWERLAITPDVELHVRRPLDRQTNKRVDQLERIARELFEDP